MILSRSLLLPLTQFFSLENPEFGLSVKISFHNFSHILYWSCTICISSALPKTNCIFSIRLEPCSPRAFFPSLCYCTVLVVTNAQNTNCWLPPPLHFRIVKAHETWWDCGQYLMIGFVEVSLLLVQAEKILVKVFEFFNFFFVLSGTRITSASWEF